MSSPTICLEGLEKQVYSNPVLLENWMESEFYRRYRQKLNEVGMRVMGKHQDPVQQFFDCMLLDWWDQYNKE